MLTMPYHIIPVSRLAGSSRSPTATVQPGVSTTTITQVFTRTFNGTLTTTFTSVIETGVLRTDVPSNVGGCAFSFLSVSHRPHSRLESQATRVPLSASQSVAQSPFSSVLFACFSSAGDTAAPVHATAAATAATTHRRHPTPVPRMMSCQMEGVQGGAHL